MIYVKIRAPEIVFKVLNFESIITVLFLLLTAVGTKWHIQFVKKTVCPIF